MNWVSQQRLVHLATNQRSTMEYLEGSIKCLVRARNTSVPSKPSVAPAPVTVTKTSWSSTSLSIEEWTNCDAQTIELLLFNTKDAIEWKININGTVVKAWQSYINIYENALAMAQQNAIQDLYNTLYIDHTNFDLFITILQKKISNINALGGKLTDEDFKLIILNVLPQSWDSVVASLYGNINSVETISRLQSWYTRIS